MLHDLTASSNFCACWAGEVLLSERIVALMKYNFNIENIFCIFVEKAQLFFVQCANISVI